MNLWRLPFLAGSACLATFAHGDPTVVPSPLRLASVRATPGVSLDLDPSALAALREADEALIPDFVFADGTTGAVLVSRSRVLSDASRVVVMTAQGERPLDISGMTLVCGSRLDDPSVRVVLSFSEAGVNGVVLGADGSQQIISGGPGGMFAPVIFDPQTLPAGAINWLSMPCGTDHLPIPPTTGQHASSGPGDRGVNCRAATLAIETDWEYTRDIFGGNTVAAAQYAVTLIAADSEIYFRDIGVQLGVGYLRVWAGDTDPYSTTNTIDRLFEFQDYWNAHETGVQRNAAHILSGVRGSYGGVAYLPGLCQDQYDYGLSTYLNGSFPYPLGDHRSQNWDLNVTAHELGHNFGAPHTHDLSPPIDSCGLGDCSQAAQGTIMSYCHVCSGGEANIALTLHQRMINEKVLPYINNDAPCTLDASGISVTKAPASVHVAVGSSATFQIAAVTAPGSLAFRWYRDNVPMNDGGRFSGTHAATLSISNVQSVDFGTYAVHVTGMCGTETRTAMLMCVADFNSDGAVDFFDYDDFVVCFEGGSCPAGASADFNADTAVDFFDYDDFVVAFETMC